jgi:hypothetical protein
MRKYEAKPIKLPKHLLPLIALLLMLLALSLVIIAWCNYKINKMDDEEKRIRKNLLVLKLENNNLSN